MEPLTNTSSSTRRRIQRTISDVPTAESSLEHDLQRLKSQRLRQSYQPIYIPLMARLSQQASDRALFPLMEKVQGFLAGNDLVMLILGDSGSGKSTFIRHLESTLWRAYQIGGTIPLFINLPEQTETDLIQKKLSNYGFSASMIMEIKQHRRLVLICDGYDESRLASNLHTINLFNMVGQWSTKLVIACRSQYLGADYRRQFQPSLDRYASSSHSLFQEVVIAPFSADQIESFIEHYIPLEPRTWVKQDYMDKFAKIPNFMEMVSNPFLLTISLEALPAVVEHKSDLSRLRITRAELFDTFINHWISVGWRRLQHVTLKDDGTIRDLRNQFPDSATFSRLMFDFSTRLASAIFDNQDGIPVVQYIPSSDASSWKASFFGPESTPRLLREFSPLTRTGNLFRFVHRSILEYFLSLAVFDPRSFALQPGSRPSVIKLLDSTGPLFKKNLLIEPSVIQFLSERAQQHPVFKALLHTVVQQSKTDAAATTATAAANAITILVRAGVSFNGADLRGIRVPGADLSDGQFDSVQFQGADLTGVSLARAWIRGMDFTNALMADVKFGEWALSLSFSPEEQNLTVGMSDGVVSHWSTTMWNNVGPLLKHSHFTVGTAFSPDYKLVASPNEEIPPMSSDIDDCSVRLWDPEAGVPVRVLTGHTDRVTAVLFSPNGHQLVSCSMDRSVRLWDLRSGTFEVIAPEHTGNTNSIVFSPNGLRIALAGSDGTCRIWNVQDHCAGAVFQGQTAGVTTVAFSPCGRFIATGSTDKIIRTWNAGSGELQHTISGHERPITALAYSSKGTRIASGSSDGMVKLWSSESGMLGLELVGHSLDVTNLLFSPSDDLLVSSSFDTTVRWWEVGSGKFGVVSRGSPIERRTMEHKSTDSGGQDGESICVRHWSSQEGTAGTRSKGQPSKVTSVTFSADGDRLFSGGYDGTWRSLDALSGELEWAHRGHEGTVTAIACSRHGDLISASLDHTIALWDTAEGEIARVFRGHEASVTSVSFTPCNQRMVSGSADWTVRVWELSSGAVIENLVGHTQAVRSVAVSPTGNYVASGSEDTTVRLWDLRSPGSKPMLLTGHTESVSCVAYSSDGTHVASASEDKTVIVWEATTGALCYTLQGHTEGVHCVAFSPNGQWIATGGFDNTLRLWRADSGQCLDVIEDFFGAVRSVSWSPSGASFATGSEDKSVRLWRVVAVKDGIKIQLQWSPRSDVIVASKARIGGAIGLSRISRTLLLQRGAVDDANDLERMEK